MPNVPADIADVLRTMQDQIRDLQGRVSTRPALNNIQGDVTISSGGRLIVTTPTGQQVLYIGKVSPSHADGSDQQGVIIRREDGTTAFSVHSQAGGGQPATIWDKDGQAVVADDLNGGGLARPYLESAGSWFGAVEQPAFVTTSTSFTTLTMAPWFKQHPKIIAFYLVRCSDATTSGEIQLTDDSGTAISPVISIGAGAFFYSSTIGSISGAHESQTYLRWKGRVLPGSTGSIGVKGLAAYGVQT